MVSRLGKNQTSMTTTSMVSNSTHLGLVAKLVTKNIFGSQIGNQMSKSFTLSYVSNRMGKLHWRIDDSIEQQVRDYVDSEYGSGYNYGDFAEEAFLSYLRGSNSDSDEPSNQEIMAEIKEVKNAISDPAGGSQSDKKKNQGESDESSESEGPFFGYQPDEEHDVFSREAIMEVKHQPDDFVLNPAHIPKFSDDLDDAEKPLQKNELVPVARAAMRYTSEEVDKGDALNWIEYLTSNSETMRGHWELILEDLPSHPLSNSEWDRVTSEEVADEIVESEFQNRLGKLESAIEAVAETDSETDRQDAIKSVKSAQKSARAFGSEHGLDVGQIGELLDSLMDDAIEQSKKNEEEAVQRRVDGLVSSLQSLPEKPADVAELDGVDDIETEASTKKSSIETCVSDYDSVSVESGVDLEALVNDVGDACDDARERIESRIEKENEERREEIRDRLSEVESEVSSAETHLNSDDDAAHEKASEALETVEDLEGEIEELGGIEVGSVRERAEDVVSEVEERRERAKQVRIEKQEEERRERLSEDIEGFVEDIEDIEEVGGDAFRDTRKSLRAWYNNLGFKEQMVARRMVHEELKGTDYRVDDTSAGLTLAFDGGE